MAAMTSTKARNIDEYIESFPEATQKRLRQVRTLIRKIVPGAEETISYAIPTFKVNGKNLVHFAGYEYHIGFYPAPVGMEAFKKELKSYKTGKGSVQFPHNETLPIELITKMTKFRINQLEEKPKIKTRKK